jgi:hypothetical protein
MATCRTGSGRYALLQHEKERIRNELHAPELPFLAAVI